MADCCSGGCSSDKPPVDPRYRRILWIALVVNALMFFVELVGGWASGSVSLLADAVDFFGDAANYGISLFVLGLALWHLVAGLLFAYRNGDSNMRSVWLCTRNDAIGNVAVMLAALGVFHTGSGLPDLFVAGVMGVLGLTAARSVIVQARSEMTAAPAPIVELKRR
ncbi:MAG: cation transporter [Massilia sp.]|nr:cation transporter [Massilia sp.]